MPVRPDPRGRPRAGESRASRPGPLPLPAPRTVWLVDDDPGFRDLTAEVAREASIAVMNLSAEAFAAQPRVPLPDGAMLDGVVLSHSESERFLTGVSRIVICTGLEYAQLRARWTQHPHVRVLLKPFQLDDLDAALRWLAGGDEEIGWQAQPRRSPEASAAPTAEQPAQDAMRARALRMT